MKYSFRIFTQTEEIIHDIKECFNELKAQELASSFIRNGYWKDHVDCKVLHGVKKVTLMPYFDDHEDIYNNQ